MKTLAPLLALACIAACSQSKPLEPQTATPVKFEVRDFKVTVDRNERGASYVGRGTLLTTDVRLKAGSYMVWLAVKKGHNNDQESRYTVALRDGVGTIDIRDHFASRIIAEITEVKYSDWRVIGYVPLHLGTIDNGPAPSASMAGR